MKRILYVEGNRDGTIGGSHHSLLGLLSNVNKNKYKPYVVFYEKNKLINKYEQICQTIILKKRDTISIKEIIPKFYNKYKNNYLITNIIKFSQKIYNFLFNYLPDLIQIVLILKKKKIDLVHINNAPIFTEWLIASKILRIKCVSHFRGIITMNYLQKKLVSCYDKVIAISNAVIDHVNMQKVNISKFTLIYNGIDINGFIKAKTKGFSINKEFKVKENTPIIGLIGNIREWKGQRIAIEAIKLLKNKNKDVVCLIVGKIANNKDDTDYLAILNKYIVDNKIKENIIFAGYRDDISDIIHGIDILIHTSILPEPFGRVIIEGMAAKKPVIATKHGGPEEIIENGVSGYLIEPNNSKILTDQIEYLLDNKKIARKIGENSRKRVDKYFDIKINTIKTEKIYEELIGIEV